MANLQPFMAAYISSWQPYSPSWQPTSPHGSPTALHGSPTALHGGLQLSHGPADPHDDLQLLTAALPLFIESPKP